MNVLITGGAGFLGAHAFNALQQAGHRVFVYDRARPAADMLFAAPGLAHDLRIGAIDDLQRMAGVCRTDSIDAIIHMAALVGFKPSLLDPVAFYKTNVMGLVNVCEAARLAGVPRLVTISSSSVYHAAQTGRLVETDVPFSVTRANPSAHYGTSKMAGEAIGMAYAEFHGLDFLALRVSAIYGFGMRSALHIKPMVEDAVMGKPTHIATGGRMKRDFVHVLDVANALVRALGSDRHGVGAQRVLNVSSGQLYLSSDLAAHVRRVIPPADIEIGEALTALEEENLKLRAPLDNSMAKAVLGWAPQWQIEEGLGQYADSFRAYLRLH
jgi:nucleoside-diphosphate-sugar epimerase